MNKSDMVSAVVIILHVPGKSFAPNDLNFIICILKFISYKFNSQRWKNKPEIKRNDFNVIISQ